ncbi:hypothetical protein GQ457_09G011910 [Hibiscus cannabinus]
MVSPASPHNPKKQCRRDDEPPDTGDPAMGGEMNPKSIPTPAAASSYKDKLMNNNPIPYAAEEIIDEEDFEILEGEVLRSVIDGVIHIDFSDRIQDLAIKSLDKTIVIKLLGWRIGYNTLRNKLYELWKPSQPFRLMDIENDYFLVTFRSHLDLLKVLADGPWTIFGYYLTVEPWSPDFSISQLYPRKIVAWIRLPGLPVTLYKRNLIEEIGESIGLVIKIDFQTESGRRGRFARMAINIDFHQPLVSKLVINGRVQIVEYESLPTVCFSCGTYGHVQENCPKLNSNVDSAPSDAAPSTNIPHPAEKEAFGPWMVVDRRQRRTPRKPSEASPANPGIPMSTSRFNPILDSMDTLQDDPIVVSTDRGKQPVSTVTPVSILRRRVTDTVAESGSKPTKSKQAIPVQKPLTLSHGPAAMRMSDTPGISRQSRRIPRVSSNLDTAKHSAIVLSENDDPNMFSNQMVTGTTSSSPHVETPCDPPDPGNYDTRLQQQSMTNPIIFINENEMVANSDAAALNGSAADMEA